jgi:hypothetical protein
VKSRCNEIEKIRGLKLLSERFIHKMKLEEGIKIKKGLRKDYSVLTQKELHLMPETKL